MNQPAGPNWPQSDKKDNHIRVMLEFIPVEERLPEEGHYYCMDDGGLITDGDAVYLNRAYKALPNGWVTRFGTRVFPTHWAKIPEIQHNGCVT